MSRHYTNTFINTALKDSHKKRRLRVGVYAGFAPFVEKRTPKQWGGWDIRFLENFARGKGFSLDFVEIDQFAGIWNAPARGVCDIVAAGIGDTKKRRSENSDVQWSCHYYSVMRAFVIKKSKDSVLQSIHDLENKTVIVTKNSNAHIDLLLQMKEARLSSVTIQYTDDEHEGVKKVLSGEAFAYGGGVGSIEYLRSKYAQLEVAWRHRAHESLLVENTDDLSAPKEEYFSFVLKKEARALTHELNAFIRQNRNMYGKDV